MKTRVIFFLCIFVSLLYPLQGYTTTYNPKANLASVIISGDVRFTVLTPRVIRMEWDSTKTFNDQSSFLVINRNLPVPEFTRKEKGGWIIIKTNEMELKYKKNTGKFTKENLQIKYLDKQEAFVWRPDNKQKGNLKGTYRTLDGYDGEYIGGKFDDKSKKMPIEDGILSTDGWTLIDESTNFLFDQSDWPWVEERKDKNTQDWYFMAYGKHYKNVLKDFTLIAGKVPLPPRYAFGYWWSRYWNYSDNDLRNLVANFEKYSIPLDVLVIDMDWHETDRHQWTGWTWDKNLFPAPDKFLQWTKAKNLKVTLNLHPADGIAPFEEPYEEFAKKMNFDTSAKKNIPYEGSNKKFMQNLFGVILHPMEKQGVDFWWLDWQQWATDKNIKGLSNTWWLNYTFFTDMERNSEKRPLIYHRWGGLGNHRYQIGFSGDSYITWESLAFQPYFTNIASNVLYTYWSHDIGGHMFFGKNYLDPELYVRWMQYGALSPIFRTHSTKNPLLNKEIWNFKGEYFDALQKSISLRYELAPYIYTMARKTYDEGIGLCRPMYYDYPKVEQAYQYPSQYMFGDNVLVAPIGKAGVEGISKVKVWLPAGDDWYEWQTGTMLKGGQEIEREFTIDEYPIYIKAGAVIPMYHNVKNLQSEPNQTVIGIFPGNSGSFDIYEDAGDDKNYDTQYALTTVSSVNTDRTQHITIFPRKGAYKEMPETKDYTIKVYGAEMPKSVSVNGVKLNYGFIMNNRDWNYSGKELAIIIPLPLAQCNSKHEIVIEYDKEHVMNVNVGLVKRFKELSKRYSEYKFGSHPCWPSGIVPEVVGRCEETNRKIEYEPERFYEHIDYFISNEQKSWDLMK